MGCRGKGAYSDRFKKRCVKYCDANYDKSNKDLAKDLDISTYSVVSWCKEFGRPRPRCYIVHESIDWEPIDPLLGKMRNYKIAEKFGISQWSVSQRIKKLGITPFPIENAKTEFKVIGPMMEIMIKWTRPDGMDELLGEIRECA